MCVCLSVRAWQTNVEQLWCGWQMLTDLYANLLWTVLLSAGAHGLLHMDLNNSCHGVSFRKQSCNKYNIFLSELVVWVNLWCGSHQTKNLST